MRIGTEKWEGEGGGPRGKGKKVERRRQEGGKRGGRKETEKEREKRRGKRAREKNKGEVEE